MRRRLPVVYRSALPIAFRFNKLPNELAKLGIEIELIEPLALERKDFYLTHEQNFVDEILALKKPNGHGTYSKDVVEGMPFVCGAVYRAALKALESGVAAALVSGFRHAGHAQNGKGSTFNGLTLTAMKLIAETKVSRLAIIDLDNGLADGTQDIIDRLCLHDRIFHFSIDAANSKGNSSSDDLMSTLLQVQERLLDFKPEIIIYQAGANNNPLHRHEAYLDEDQISQRDSFIFQMAKGLQAPIVWIPSEMPSSSAQPGESDSLAFDLITFEEACLVFDIFCRSLANEAMGVVDELCRLQDYRSASEICDHWLGKYPEESDFWILKGIADGHQGNNLMAQNCFLEALARRSDDGVALANLFAACLNLGLVERSFDMISRFISGLSVDQREPVFDKVDEAIRQKLITCDQLPEHFSKLLSQRGRV